MSKTGKTPLQQYEERLQSLRASEAKYHARDRAFVALKLALVALAAILGVYLLKRHVDEIGWVFLAIPIFLLLFVLHEKILNSLHLCRRLLAYYEQGLARIKGEWVGKGNQGERYLEAAHPYARDLDIFGTGSLFELLCQTRTRNGEKLLADWLLHPATPELIHTRQAAVRDLQDRLGLREVLATAGEDAGVGVHPEELIAWGEKTCFSHALWLRLAMLVLASIWLFSIVAWQAWGYGWFALAMSILTGAITYRLRFLVTIAAEKVEKAGHDLAILSGVLAGIESESFQSPGMIALQAALKTEGIPPSQAIAQLQKKVDWLESGHNWFVRLFNPFVFYTPQCLFAIENWRLKYGEQIRIWLSTVSQVEALSSLANYAYEHPSYPMPTIVESGPYLEAKELAHPLLPEGKAVSNDIQLSRTGLQMLMISGPNMAGKSTFLRGLGVNVVLALAGAPVRAVELKVSPLAVAASICVLDSLQGGLSRFYAEIKRLKQIVDLSERELPVFFLFDELLSGTNSHDRRVGTESVLKNLVANGAIGLVTTHDLALTKIAETIGQHAANYHFSDRFQEGELIFDYKLHPGIVQTTNALTLMQAIGLKI